MSRIDAQNTRVARHGGANAQDAQLQKAARQFEALFLQQLLGEMRKSAGESGGLGSSAGAGIYESMVDQAVADHMTEGRGVGVASYLYRQWTGQSMAATPTISAGAMISSGSASNATPDAHEHQVPGVNEFDFNELPKGKRDDGVTPLREMLPPTGLEGEKDLFSLNTPSGGPDGRFEGIAPNGGSYGRETHATDNDNSEARPGRGSHSESSGRSTGRTEAIAAYRRFG